MCLLTSLTQPCPEAGRGCSQSQPKLKVTLGLVSLNGRISSGEGTLPSHRLMRLCLKQLEVCIIPTNLGSKGRGAEVAQKLLRVE